MRKNNKLNMDYIIKETYWKLNNTCSQIDALIQELVTISMITEYEHHIKYTSEIKDVIEKLKKSLNICLDALYSYRNRFRKRLDRLIFKKKYGNHYKH